RNNPQRKEGERNERYGDFEARDLSRTRNGAPRAHAPRADRARVGLPHRLREAQDVAGERRVRPARGRKSGPALRPLEHLVGGGWDADVAIREDRLSGEERRPFWSM